LPSRTTRTDVCSVYSHSRRRRPYHQTCTASHRPKFFANGAANSNGAIQGASGVAPICARNCVNCLEAGGQVLCRCKLTVNMKFSSETMNELRSSSTSANSLLPLFLTPLVTPTAFLYQHAVHPRPEIRKTQTQRRRAIPLRQGNLQQVGAQGRPFIFRNRGRQAGHGSPLVEKAYGNYSHWVSEIHILSCRNRD